MALVVAVGILAILVAVSGGLIRAADSVKELVLDSDLELRASYASLAGINYGISSLRTFAASPAAAPDGGLSFNSTMSRSWFNGGGTAQSASVDLGSDDNQVGTRFRVGLIQNGTDTLSLYFNPASTQFYNNTDIRVFILHSEGEVVDTQNNGKVMARVTMEQRFVSASVVPYRLDRL